jgi:poly [ADP-ribose] polymerase
MSTVKEHKKYICVCFGDTNNNKVWQYTIYEDGTALTEWGRVGKKLQSKATTPAKALKKLAEKTRPNNKPDKLYTEVKVAEGTESSSSSGNVVNSSSLKSIAQKQIDIKDPTLKELVDFLVKENVHQIVAASGGSISYDTKNATFRTPLGVILPDQVSDARDLLDDMADYVTAQKFTSVKFARLLNDYLRLIPHAVGMSKISPKLILPDDNALQAENNLLDGLTVSFNDIKDGVTASTGKKAKKVDTPKLFDVTLDVVRDRAEIARIKKYFNDTKLNMHVTAGYSIKKVYTVRIGAMDTAFKKVGLPIGNVQELWHGTKCSNLLSILKIGLIIPRSSSGHVTGRMFGDGLYFSDQSTKALNYATNFWRGGGSTRRIFMFLADVAMGKHYTPSGWSSNLPKAGYDSTFAKGRKSGVSNNEMIVYKTNQANLKYLIEFE